MISFIIIGRNEGWKLTKCLESVFNTIEYNQLTDYEVIYVDSKSTDDSIKRGRAFNNLKIIALLKDFNAAIARNIGAKESKGETLYFIDGDMTITKEFLQLVYDKTGLKYPFVTGQFKNIFSENGIVNTKPYHTFKNGKDKIELSTGGLFLIKRRYWDQLNGMDIKFVRSQDIDFGLRLMKKGVKLLRKKDLMALHYTIEYTDKKRMWQLLLDKSELYGRSLIYRKHFNNSYMYRILVKNDYSFITLLISGIIAILISNLMPLLVYIFFVFYRSCHTSGRLNVVLTRLFYYLIRDVLVLSGIFLFWPKEQYEIDYQILK